MTRKHFKAIADAIAVEYRQAEDFRTRVVIRNIADNIASNAREFNPNFDEQRFIDAACPIDK